MKFHCERCKTRYSIADERVKGKVLKIRCKNCSAVITVKDGEGDAEPPAPTAPATARPAAAESPAAATSARPAAASASPKRAGGAPSSALAGAFAKAMEEPAAGDSMSAAPASYDVEWYVSADGEQEGPYGLAKAQAWVASRGPDDDLHCWSEGFDDWLPIDKVSHFRGLRGGAKSPAASSVARPAAPAVARPAAQAAARPAAPAAANEDTPKPLFARAMARITAEAPVATPEASGGALRTGGPASGEDAPNDFEIGEASQVFNMAMLASRATGATGAHPRLPGLAVGNATAGLAAIGHGTGAADRLNRTGGFATLGGLTPGPGELPRPESLAPRPSRHKMLVLLGGGGVLVLVAIVVILVATLGGSDEHEGIERAGSGDDSLAYQVMQQAQRAEKAAKDAEATAATTRKIRRPRDPVVSGGIIPTPGVSDEVELGGSADAPRPLTPDDLIRVHEKNQLGLQMCFNRALKRDPYLKVPKTSVTLKVGLNGLVQSVAMPGLAGSELGICLEGFIKRWRFPRATEVFTGQFQVVFSSR